MRIWGIVALTLATALAGAAGRVVEIGRVTRVLARADITRGGFSGQVQENASVAENDRIQTQDGARARVVLNDGSILTIGSRSALVIKNATTSSRAGSLEIAYGMVRAQVASNPGPNRFQVRTQTAVMDVLGTTVFIDATPGSSHIVNLSDPASGSQVRVASANPRIRGEVLLNPGEGTVVEQGKPPIPPHAMGPDVTRHFVADTDIP